MHRGKSTWPAALLQQSSAEPGSPSRHNHAHLLTQLLVHLHMSPQLQRLQQLMLTADVRAWAAMLTAAAPVDPAAAAMLTMAATAAADLALLRGAALDLVAALPADRAQRDHKAKLLADVAWMDRAARRMMAVAVKVGRSD